MLRLGADDYLVKPLRRAEFLARVESLCRRASRFEAAFVTLDMPPYRVDFAANSISLGHRSIELRPRLMAIAMLLFQKHGQVVSRAEIYEKVWGTDFSVQTRTIDTHISQLRKALQLDGSHGLRLESIYQHGYRLSAKPREDPGMH
jgi:DNA-binding response OmpR family regulator